jgi:hypothetical protein
MRNEWQKQTKKYINKIRIAKSKENLPEKSHR